MTAWRATERPSGSRFNLKLAFAMALRELRSGAGGLAVFVLCIALGVAAVAAIGSLAASFDEALARQGRLLIGGDLAFELIHREASAEERAALDALGAVSQSASFRAMARTADGKNALIEVKAVDDAYPLYGEVSMSETERAGYVWRSPSMVLVERTLLDRLSLAVGKKLAIGAANVAIGGILGEQPDRLADRLAYGPKLLMSRETLAKTGPGAARQPHPLDLPGETPRLARERQGGARRRPCRHREQVSASRLRHPRLDRPRAVSAPRGRPLHPIHQLRRADGAASWRHRRRQRHPELHGQEARDHRHVQMPRRRKPSRSRRLSDPGASADRYRHCHRASHRRTDAGHPCGRLWRCAAHHACHGAAPLAAPDRVARRAAHHGAVRAMAARPRRLRAAGRADALSSHRGA